MQEKDYQQKIQDLELQVKKKDAYIEHLEKLSEAYSNLSELFNQQLLETDRTLKAHEIIQTMMIEEKKQAEETIKAHEMLEILAAEEKKNAEETIKAHEGLENLIIKEKKQAEETIKAHEMLEQLSIQEKMEAEKVIQAHESLQNLNMLEKAEADKILKAQEEVNSLSSKEISERDKTLQTILNINKKISSILDLDSLLDNILKSLVESVHAQRGIVFLQDKSVLAAKLFLNMDKKEINKTYFKFARSVIYRVKDNKKSSLIINHKISQKGRETSQSLICVPLIYKEEFLGLLYLDILSDQDNFKENDLYLSEIFSSQAAISINNVSLYEKIKHQNRELLHLINLNGQFVNHISNDLIEPLNKLNQQMEKSLTDEAMPVEEKEALIQASAVQLKKLKNTVEKVFAVKTLEEEVEDLFKDQVNFGNLFNEIFIRHEDVLKTKNIQVQVDLRPEFENYLANKYIMKIIFDELLTNAAFYNKQNGSIHIKGYPKENYLYVDIIDTGYGIKPEELENIFLQFYRSPDSSSLNEYGAGLGLYMVRESLKYYGGTVSVESTYGKGSQFTVKFLS